MIFFFIVICVYSDSEAILYNKILKSFYVLPDRTDFIVDTVQKLDGLCSWKNFSRPCTKRYEISVGAIVVFVAGVWKRR